MSPTEQEKREYPLFLNCLTLAKAAKEVGLSKNRLLHAIETHQLRAWRTGKILYVDYDEVRHFAGLSRAPAQRTLSSTSRLQPLSRPGKEQLLTVISVQIRPQQRTALLQRLATIARQEAPRLFPGTAARYVFFSATWSDLAHILLIWKLCMVPTDQEREQALNAQRDEFADFLDWQTATSSVETMVVYD